VAAGMTAQLQALRAALATVRQLEEQIETATKAVEATMTEQEMDAVDDLDKCPNCGGPADNGHDRCLPPSPYFCVKCNAYD